MVQIHRVCQAFILTAALGLLAPAQETRPGEAAYQEPAPDPGFVIRTETQLVLVPFHAVNKKKYVGDLQKDDFQVLEDGVPQKVAVFEGPPGSGGDRRTIPIEVTLLLDVSLSVMNHNLLNTVTLKETFLDELGDDVQISVYAFAQKLKRFTAPTNDVDQIAAALDGAYEFAHGGTRLYEAVMRTCTDVSRSGSNATRLMVVLSDGFSTATALPDNAVTLAQYYGITLYPVILGHDRVVARGAAAPMTGGAGWGAGGNRRNPWGGQSLPGIGKRTSVGAQGARNRQSQARYQEEQMADFAEIGESTGGRSFDPKTVNSMMVRAILQSIVGEVQAQYVAGYYPSVSDELASVHKVEVSLRGRDGKIYGGKRLVTH